jgi:hypothetical protein
MLHSQCASSRDLVQTSWLEIAQQVLPCVSTYGVSSLENHTIAGMLTVTYATPQYCWAWRWLKQVYWQSLHPGCGQLTPLQNSLEPAVPENPARGNSFFSRDFGSLSNIIFREFLSLDPFRSTISTFGRYSGSQLYAPRDRAERERAHAHHGS